MIFPGIGSKIIPNIVFGLWPNFISTEFKGIFHFYYIFRCMYCTCTCTCTCTYVLYYSFSYFQYFLQFFSLTINIHVYVSHIIRLFINITLLEII